MIHKKTFLIGLMVILGAFVPRLAHAQGSPSGNCIASLYDSEFVCDSANVRSFCSITALADETPDAIVDTSSALAYYKSSYCNVQRDSDDEVIAAVAEQMKVEDPKWDEDLVRMTLTYVTGSTLREFAGGESEEQLSKLPASLVDSYIRNANFTGQNEIYNWVKSAYEKEKVMAQSKSSLKQQFKGREMWANGSLSDAPFDLIVDLNLIEIVMFGSGAQWMDNVYSFPRKESGAGIGGVGVGGATPPPNNIKTKKNTPIQPDTIVCVSEGEFPGLEPSANCGNGKVDGDEQCDDGNTKAGDGCSDTCKDEPGNSLACRDPEAVTFKPFVPKTAQPSATPGGQAAGNVKDSVSANVPPGGIPINCPPGSTPAVKPPPQSYNYPGPNVGGVLKAFPPSNKTGCPAGMTEAKITFADPRTIEGNNPLTLKSTTVSRCVPTPTCDKGYEGARKLIYGELYKEDNAPDPNDSLTDKIRKKAVLKGAEALEAFVCVEVFTVNRPESPYPVNEGCIDCHVLGMNDIMSKLLENNVSCLENNMQAWGLSNRWGPKVSFNLDVVQSMSANWLRRKLAGEPPDLTSIEATQMRAKQINQDAADKLDPNRKTDLPTLDFVQDGSKILNQNVRAEELRKIEVAQGLKFYRAVSESESVDQQFHGPVSTMLEQMLGSFTRLQSLYVSLATGLKFKEKEECTFE